MAYETLLVERKDQITTITLNRPQSKNAMNPLWFRLCRLRISNTTDKS